MLQYGAFTKCNKVIPTSMLPLPPLLEQLLDVLQAAGIVRGPDERPDTCVVNVYASGSWLPHLTLSLNLTLTLTLALTLTLVRLVAAAARGQCGVRSAVLDGLAALVAG